MSVKQKLVSFRSYLPLATLAIAIVIEVVRRFGGEFPVPFLILYGSVALVAGSAGRRPGIWSAISASVFVVYASVIDYGPDSLTGGVPQVVLGCSVAFLLTVVIGTLRDDREKLISNLIATQDQLARERALLSKKVATQTRGIREMARRLISVQEVERANLSRDLHENFAQSLAALRMCMSVIQRGVNGCDDQWRSAFGIVDGISEDIRAVARSLRPALLDQFGLETSLRRYIETQCRRGDLDAVVDSRSLPDSVGKELDVLCFRCVQEAISNVMEHADATRVQVSLEMTDGNLHIGISDNGCGFNVPAEWKIGETGGFGLFGVQERLSLYGGILRVNSKVGTGTTVDISVPID